MILSDGVDLLEDQLWTEGELHYLYKPVLPQIGEEPFHQGT